MTIIYNDPAGGDNSSVGNQIRTDFFHKKALIEAKKTQFFGQLADVQNMPKNMGKKIKTYHYLPLLDDANINDQGIDAQGLTTTRQTTIIVTSINGDIDAQLDGSASLYFVGEGANEAAAILAAKTKVNEWAQKAVVAGGLGVTLVGADELLKYTDAVNSTDGLAYVKGYRFAGDTTADDVPVGGNLYGSSKDVGTISGKLPALSETGGRVNRVGFKRVELEGTLEKFGFFDEWTKESLDFDSDAELEQHLSREMIMGANEMTEDALQIDLLNAAGIVRYAGAATTTAELSGETGAVDLITYADLRKLAIDLDNNRTPKQTKIITGTRMVDTKTIGAARIMYIGSELEPMIEKMVDDFGNQAFVPVEKYGAATTLLEGEIGQVGKFKIVSVPEMMHWEGAGATVSTNDGYRQTNGKYDVFPMLVVGSGSFTTIGFQTDGKTVKFKIKTVNPETDAAYSKDDPFGESGFTSIKWYYGFMALRPERIALCKTVAEY